MYDPELYPNYLSGTGYVMSVDVADKLFKTTLETPIFHLEDVYLSGNFQYKIVLFKRVFFNFYCVAGNILLFLYSKF